MQKLSIFSCIFTLLGSPVIIQMGNASASLGSKAAIAATLGTFGCFTTGGRTSLACTAGILSHCHGQLRN